jgi:hypothetical protein
MNKNQILSYYKMMIKEAKKMQLYNFREHAIRKIRYDFRKRTSFEENVLKGEYEQLKRIVCVQNMYYKEVLI